MTDYTNFRQRLDAVLRTLDVKRVREFLIAENQWSVGVPADPEFAMMLMIAGSSTLRDLHEHAREWLVSHGHEEEANAVLGKGKGGKQGAKAGKRPSSSQASKGQRQNRQPSTSHTKKSGSAKRDQSG